MIFKQIPEIVAGLKTQTRRVVQPGETAYGRKRIPGKICAVAAPNRLKWEIGRTYAVVPKRGAATYIHEGRPLRIELTGIRRERLHDISEDDAQAEGIEPVPGLCGWKSATFEVAGDSAVECYRRIWEKINTSKGTRWDDNPLVWVLEFCDVPGDKRQ